MRDTKKRFSVKSKKKGGDYIVVLSVDGEEMKPMPSSAEKTREQHEEDVLFGLKGVNMETGIRNCGGNRNVYIRILQTFSSSNLHSGLETYYEASDWNNYEVIAHSIKGACRNIGAEDIAEKAYQLELAGKRGDDKQRYAP